MKISTILDNIDLGAVALPEFQRGYVWNRDQVRGLMDSLYRRHPVGSLLVWVTPTESATARGDASLTPGYVQLLLDGQQRMTSLYGIIRGKEPEFFEGNAKAFTDLRFHLDKERFAFFQPLKMKDDPLWIDVTELMQKGVGDFMQRLSDMPDYSDRFNDYLTSLNTVLGIKDIEVHVEQVTGEDKTIDVVVDIFNRVNSGGTKLSKGDLALAKICADWPEARAEMNDLLAKWRNAGFNFRLELLLRTVNTVLTGEALFSALADVDTDTFREGLKRANRYTDSLLNLIGSRLGLDHDRVLGGRYALPLMARYLELRGGKLTDATERDNLLHWYVHSFLWGRYAGSTESVLNQDLDLIEESDGAIDRLLGQLRQNRGDLRLHPNDFLGWSRGARFYPLLYMLTRVWKARDWDSGLELSRHLLGTMSQLELHHIFPKALLYKHDYQLSKVNSLANFTFLTKETNLAVSDRDPAEYLAEIAAKDPSLLSSHWIPLDPELWKIDRYEDFLEARRLLLAEAANAFLDSLAAGTVPETGEKIQPSETVAAQATVLGGHAGDGEEEIIIAINEWIVAQGLPEGDMLYDLADAETGAPLAVLDIAWPEGLQEGLSQPVTLLIDESPEVEEAANRAGFLFFTDEASFRAYVEQEILAVEEEAA